MKKVKQDEMIDFLINDDFETILNQGMDSGKSEYLFNILMFGHKGYSRMTRNELEIEYECRKEG